MISAFRDEEFNLNNSIRHFFMLSHYHTMECYF